ncbi:MAG TPA: single-stranded DNA-binding protein [Syntrophorhabdaceae bacterium]|nr:single-stranded DNA-binding protein [Syntrophorhabdaceae bacterium]
MSSLNKVLLIGRLGADPELRSTADGIPVATFNVATSETYKDRSGVKQEKTEWHRIVAWRKLGEIAGEYLRKGKLVYIEGKIQSREFEGKDGIKRKTFEIVASEMKMLGSAGEGRQSGEERKPYANHNGDDDFVHEVEDDVPM